MIARRIAETLPALILLLCLATAARPQEGGPSTVLVPADASADDRVALAASLRPSPRQLAWQERAFSAFVHFGMNTFTDREWGEGDEEPELFDPEDLDVDQWCEVFADAGMTGLVLTCKHHDGFCLWPSSTTAHSVRFSPWRQGKGDLVREVAEACRRHGLSFGVYLSPWDRNHPDYGTPEYDGVFATQLRELLENYGPIAEVWLDGANAPADDPELFDWAAHFALVRELQPEACISISGPDVRWVGNEGGRARASEWSVIPLDTAEAAPAEASSAVAAAYRAVDLAAPDLGARKRLQDAKRLVWWPAVVNTSIRPGWFHHSAEDDRVRGVRELFELWTAAVGGNAHFLLNVPPDRRGLIHEIDARRLRDLGRVLRAAFRRDLCADGLRKDYGRVGEVVFPESRRLDTIVLGEDLAASGQRVESLRIDLWDGSSWREHLRTGAVGHRRILRFPEVRASGIRYWVERSRKTPRISRFSAYLGPRIAEPPRIERDREGRVAILGPEGAEIRYTLDGSAPDRDALRYEAPFELPRGGAVRARVFAEESEGLLVLGDAATGTRRFGLSKGRWSVHSASSEQAPGEAAALAIDDDPGTIWHTRYSPDTPRHPHTLEIDLGAEERVSAVGYLPRRDGSNGRLVGYAFETSLDGESWTRAADGAFGNAKEGAGLRIVKLEETQRARYLRLVALSAVDDRPWASVAEIEVFAD